MTDEEIRRVARAEELIRISQKALDEVEAALIRGFHQRRPRSSGKSKILFRGL